MHFNFPFNFHRAAAPGGNGDLAARRDEGPEQHRGPRAQLLGRVEVEVDDHLIRMRSY